MKILMTRTRRSDVSFLRAGLRVPVELGTVHQLLARRALRSCNGIEDSEADHEQNVTGGAVFSIVFLVQSQPFINRLGKPFGTPLAELVVPSGLQFIARGFAKKLHSSAFALGRR